MWQESPLRRFICRLIRSSLAVSVLLSSLTLGATASAARVSPSSPDDLLPSAGAEIDQARLLYDRQYIARGEARKAILEIGRPLLEPLPGLSDLGGDPVVNLDSGLTYSSLQAAINAATAGDTLQVVADLSEGPVTVDRDLFIEGATGAETLFATQDTGSTGDARAWILVEAGVALVVRDLGFDGNGFKIYQAFRHRGFGLIESCSFRDIQFESSGPLYQGTAVVAFGDRVDVVGSSFEQIGRVGVLFFGASVAGAIYAGNSYIGKGDGDFLDYALELNAGATAWVIGNSVRSNRGIASVDGSSSAAMQATTFSGAGTVAMVDSNDFTDSLIGLAVGFPGIGDSTTVSASFNRFLGNDVGLQSASSVMVAAENNWWGCNLGPGMAGCDAGGVEDAGSLDLDPWLVLELRPLGWIKPSTFKLLTADLHHNSDGQDTSSSGLVIDGIPGLFSADALASVAPSLTESDGGKFTTFLIAGEDEGDTITAISVDNQIVQESVRIEVGLFCDGFESGDLTAWSSFVG